MEDLNAPSTPLFKKLDVVVFENIDKFKQSPSYSSIQDFYNGLEEEQQKLFKGLVILLIFLLPLLGLGFIWWQNSSYKSDLETRISLVERANEIISKGQNLGQVYPNILSQNPIDGSSMMTSRLSNLLSSSGVDISKIQVSNYQGNMISSTVMKSEADFSFKNLSTDELMNMFSAMITREKVKIESVQISRNSTNNLLQGQFHGIHLGQVQPDSEAD